MLTVIKDYTSLLKKDFANTKNTLKFVVFHNYRSDPDMNGELSQSPP